MTRKRQLMIFIIFAAPALVIAQMGEVTRVLSEIRTALGGEDKLAAVKTVAIAGQTARSAPDGTSVSQDFELAFDLSGPAAKYVKKDVLMTVGGQTISSRSGFNGNDVIEEVETPPAMHGGNVRMMRLTPDGLRQAGQGTPDQIERQKAQLLASRRREFAQLALGMLGASTPAYPVEFIYAGQAEAPDGQADVLEVKSPDGFTAKLFVDSKTHLPLMLLWMDQEPLRMTMTAGGGGQIAKMQEDLAARVKEAEARRRTVEHRIFYGDYRTIDGVRIPTRIQRMVDGSPTEELTFDKITVNGKIDTGRFAVAR